MGFSSPTELDSHTKNRRESFSHIELVLMGPGTFFGGGGGGGRGGVIIGKSELMQLDI